MNRVCSCILVRVVVSDGLVYKCVTTTTSGTVVLGDAVTSVLILIQAAFRLICAADDGALGKTGSVEGTNSKALAQQQ